MGSAVHETKGVIKLVILLLALHFVAGKDFCRDRPGQETCTSTTEMICNEGQRPQIVEAYYKRTAYKSHCGTNCTPTALADPQQCLKTPQQNEHQCVQRLSFTYLNVVYKSCAPQRYCNFSSIDKSLSLPDPFIVKYLCLEENSTIDPCKFSGSPKTNAYFLLRFKSPSCHRHCNVTPLNTDRAVFFNYWFIQGFDEKRPSVNENEIKYRFITEKSGRNPAWKTFHSVYYTHLEKFHNVTKLQMWFNLRRPDVIRHLWVSFNDTEVKISCENLEELSTFTTNSISPTTSTLRARPGKTDKNDISATPTVAGPHDEKEDGNATLIVLIVVLVVLLTAMVIAGVVTVLVIRKRLRGESQNSVRTDNSSGPTNQQRVASIPSPEEGEYSECVLPEDTSPAAPMSRDPGAEPIMVASTRCDVGGDYVHLRHDVKAGSVGEMAKRDNYDHMPGFGTGGEGDVYNTLQRERQRQEVVDNVYNTMSES